MVTNRSSTAAAVYGSIRRGLAGHLAAWPRWPSPGSSPGYCSEERSQPPAETREPTPHQSSIRKLDKSNGNLFQRHVAQPQWLHEPDLRNPEVAGTLRTF
ncbi:hypothetical protein CMUS01_14139 [Colletotrichum musicola]|uniref:Uncharacterized protein n=1 Tax=Colletotrichum musicola TaxID=2175873 RepID=A0A8H6J7C8_9PEZI|nr:hypothetical protein CMUS01_14139 [Colletotrichum musicola]